MILSVREVEDVDKVVKKIHGIIVDTRPDQSKEMGQKLLELADYTMVVIIEGLGGYIGIWKDDKLEYLGESIISGGHTIPVRIIIRGMEVPGNLKYSTNEVWFALLLFHGSRCERGFSPVMPYRYWGLEVVSTDNLEAKHLRRLSSILNNICELPRPT